MRIRRFFVILLLYIGALPSFAQEDANLVERGEYLTQIGRCVGCHTPYQPQYTGDEVSTENLQTLAFYERDALDMDRLLSGGRTFDLGPGGLVVSSNLTPDETGLGDWTDAEIESALRYGVTPTGEQLHPLMPYTTYYNMADRDIDAIIAYLRSVPAIERDLPDNDLAIAPMHLPEQDRIAPTDPDDTAAHGVYLMEAVLGCAGCHTPLDQETGEPVHAKKLGGGHPYEGPWGIVYGSNITPHETTGISNWDDAEIIRALTEGILPNGRRLVFMSWQEYALLTPADREALVYHLQHGVSPVDNAVPDAALKPDFERYVNVSPPPLRSPLTNTYISLGIFGVLTISSVLIIFHFSRKHKQ